MKSTITVENIKCGGCMNTIQTKLGAIEDVQEITVSDVTGEISFNHEKDTTRAIVEQNLTKMGYPPVGENNLGAKAKSYVSCMVGRMDA